MWSLFGGFPELFNITQTLRPDRLGSVTEVPVSSWPQGSAKFRVRQSSLCTPAPQMIRTRDYGQPSCSLRLVKKRIKL